MNSLKNILNKAKDFISNNHDKKYFIIVILGLTGIFLIFLSELFPENVSETKNSDTFSYDLSEKEEILENRLSEAISQINGAGKAKVMLTFDSSEEFLFAGNSDEEKDETKIETKSEFVIVEGKNGEEPLLIKKNEAKIRGVLIICEGGDNPLIKEKIIEAVCALLDISSNKVSVAKMAL